MDQGRGAASPIIFELCAEALGPCLLARGAGVARLELCAALDVEGLTPNPRLLRAVVERSGLPVHMMVRPRAGGFVYSAEEFDAIRREMGRGLEVGVAGFVVGVLRADGTVDEERMRGLVGEAGGREVTFHRAIDGVPSLPEALEAVIRAGCGRVLTSGGAPDVISGADALRALVEQAGDRIAVAAGGGLRVENAAELVRRTGARHFHGSVRRAAGGEVDAAEVRQMVEALEAGVLPEAKTGRRAS